MDFNVLQPLLKPADTRILLLVMDGLGGLPRESNGLTELETARTPHLDSIAAIHCIPPQLQERHLRRGT
jgi:2,3-bisphosphoglycerate-independent phosphoglycerate mutase